MKTPTLLFTLSLFFLLSNLWFQPDVLVAQKTACDPPEPVCMNQRMLDDFDENSKILDKASQNTGKNRDEVIRLHRMIQNDINEINRRVDSYDCEGLAEHVSLKESKYLGQLRELNERFHLVFPDGKCDDLPPAQQRGCSILWQTIKKASVSLQNAKTFFNERCQ